MSQQNIYQRLPVELQMRVIESISAVEDIKSATLVSKFWCEFATPSLKFKLTIDPDFMFYDDFIDHMFLVFGRRAMLTKLWERLGSPRVGPLIKELEITCGYESVEQGFVIADVLMWLPANRFKSFSSMEALPDNSLERFLEAQPGCQVVTVERKRIPEPPATEYKPVDEADGPTGDGWW